MSPHSAILISSINCLYYADICSLYTNFDESFYYEKTLNFSTAVSESIKMII